MLSKKFWKKKIIYPISRTESKKLYKTVSIFRVRENFFFIDSLASTSVKESRSSPLSLTLTKWGSFPVPLVFPFSQKLYTFHKKFSSFDFFFICICECMYIYTIGITSSEEIPRTTTEPAAHVWHLSSFFLNINFHFPQ